MENEFSQKAFAVKNKDFSVRCDSSSGGFFSPCADYILSVGGVVYGADFDENMHLFHKRATKSEEIVRMRGAKYIKSDLSLAFPKIINDLRDNTPLLFSGTPCQVKSINRLAERFKATNFYTVDLICHGVPNPKVWEKYIEFLEKRYNKKVVFFKFRDKENSWREYKSKIFFSDGSCVSHNNISGAFLELFRYDVCLQNGCTKCPFASINRVGDLTIGDFWGIEKIFPDFDDNKGVSAVIVNTKKGMELFNKIKETLIYKECSLEQIKKGQPNLSSPSKFSNKAEAFSKDFKTLPFEKVLKKYTKAGVKRRLIDFAKKLHYSL